MGRKETVMAARRAFTIVELLVVVSIIALLLSILLPAVGKARGQAQLTASQANLRNLAAAHGSYAAEWNDRQFTLVVDSLSSYGTTASQAMNAYASANGAGADPRLWHPPVRLGWARDAGSYWYWQYTMDWAPHMSFVQPIVFAPGNGWEYYGSFRLINCRQFNQYVSGRFYDATFYAPRDAVVIDSASSCLSDPGEFCIQADTATHPTAIPAWSSYVLSPAAMFGPGVMGHDVPGDEASGWRNPFSLDGGFRSPAFAQARFPSLKTHMLEHHWLQNRGQASACNPAFEPGTYAGCEPWYFNQSRESAPLALFYDGHVAGVGVNEAERADARMRVQTANANWGLWSRDTPWGDDGYMSDLGYDQAQTSFHVLTTDGIGGRDVIDD
jgi:prepilin-type N-terminal cleavage/methylation domain-containing protein